LQENSYKTLHIIRQNQADISYIIEVIKFGTLWLYDIKRC